MLTRKDVRPCKTGNREPEFVYNGFWCKRLKQTTWDREMYQLNYYIKSFLSRKKRRPSWKIPMHATELD